MAAYAPRNDLNDPGHLAALLAALADPARVLVWSGVRYHDLRTTLDGPPGDGLQLVQVMHRRAPDRAAKQRRDPVRVALQGVPAAQHRPWRVAAARRAVHRRRRGWCCRPRRSGTGSTSPCPGGSTRPPRWCVTGACPRPTGSPAARPHGSPGAAARLRRRVRRRPRRPRGAGALSTALPTGQVRRAGGARCAAPHPTTRPRPAAWRTAGRPTPPRSAGSPRAGGPRRRGVAGSARRRSAAATLR
jgi:hypothetical protein